MLLSAAFCPPVEYFALLANSPVVYIEACENYQKQSWRNRCRILSTNGPLDLTVPAVHPGGLFRETKIESTTPWLPKLQKALDSAYYSSPFFEFYREPFYELFETGSDSLWNLDIGITNWLCSKFGISPQILQTAEYEAVAKEDFRSVIHPKRSNSILSDLGLGRPYHQVFKQKFGFVPGLSAIDLLFCEGPDSVLWLKQNEF